MSNIINQSNSNVKDSKVKIIFLGTPQFAVPILEKLTQSEFKPSAVFCAQDKPVGRKQLLTPPPMKIAAEKYGISIYQPNSVSEFVILILSLKPDLIISAAFGTILPKEVLDMPQYDCLNIHPSLLPKYRGASPIQYTILNGDSETGITIIKMDEKIDHGAIVKNQKSKIKNQKLTTPELSQILSELGANLLIETLPDWLAGKIITQPQDESQATYTKIIKKTDGCVDWKKSAREIERQIRAFTPWPGAFTRIMNPHTMVSRPRYSGVGMNNESRIMNIKILEAEVKTNNAQKQIGEIFLDDSSELAVQTDDGVLIIKKLQLEGGKPMIAAEFLRGHSDIIGQFFS